jgi:hypothetical protein
MLFLTFSTNLFLCIFRRPKQTHTSRNELSVFTMRPPLVLWLAFTSLALLRGGSGVAALDIDVDATVRKQEDLDAKWGFEVRLLPTPGILCSFKAGI